MGEEIFDNTMKGETSPADSKLKADNTGSLRFTDPDDMNPDEPWILRDHDDKGLIQRYWRRKESDPDPSITAYLSGEPTRQGEAH